MRDTGRDAFRASAVDLNGPALWVGPEDAPGPGTRTRLAEALPDGAVELQLSACGLADLPSLCAGAQAPRLVAAPLFRVDGDVLETLRVLSLLGYPGPVRVVAPKLPRPDIVCRELRADCPGLDIEIVEGPEG